MPSRARRAAAIGLVVLPLLAALVPIALPPWTLPLVTLRIAAAELGPPIALLAVALGTVAARLARGAPRLRWGLAAAAVAAAALALVPTLTARAAARRAGTDALPLGLLGALRPLPHPPGVEERVVRYRAADGSPLALRRYRAPGRCPARCPTVVVLYAGAWRNGDASQSAPVDRWLAARGYTVVALDYRHAPRHRFPAQPDDVRRGLALVRDSAAAWGADPERVVLWGRSSGGQLATLTAWRGGDALPVRVRGVISYYGPFDLARGYVDRPSPDPIDGRAVLRGFVGGPPDALPDAYRAASPASWVRPGLPPTLLVYAGDDHLVKPEFGRAAAAALRAAGDSVVHLELPWAEHGFDLADGGPSGVAALGVVLHFLATVL